VAGAFFFFAFALGHRDVCRLKFTRAPAGPNYAAGMVAVNGAALRFVARFGALSAVLLGFYYFPYADTGAVKPWIDLYLHGYAASAGYVLRVFEPGVRVLGQEIVGRYGLRIVKTCDAMDVTILVVSALVAWPFPWRRRAIAILIAVAALYLVNIVRICSLYCIGARFPSLFETAHLDVWPAILLVFAVGLFLSLVARGPRPSSEPAHELA